MKLSSAPNENPRAKLLSRLAIMTALASPACSPSFDVPASPAPTQQEGGHARRAYKPRPHHPESVEHAKRGVALQGYMHPEEVQRMQVVQEELYEQYINPGFMLYAKQMNLTDKIYPNLDLAIQHPFDFEYEQKKHRRIDVKKRYPFTEANEHIPDDFLLVVDGSEPETVRYNMNNLRSSDSTLPWMTSEAFHSNAGLYNNMYRNDWRGNLYGDRYRQWMANGGQPPQEWNDIFRSSFGGIRPELKEIYEVLNIDFPKRYVDLVRARNFSFETRDARFRDIETYQGRQGTTFDAITRDGYGPNGGLQVRVQPNQDESLTERFGPVYMVLTRGNRPNPVFITEKGHMLRRVSGQWEMDPRSTDFLVRKYYADNPQAPRQAP